MAAAGDPANVGGVPVTARRTVPAHEPSTWLAEAMATARTRLNSQPRREVQIIEWLTTNPDTECDRCHGAPCDKGVGCVAAVRIRTRHGWLWLVMGLCGECTRREYPSGANKTDDMVAEWDCTQRGAYDCAMRLSPRLLADIVMNGGAA